MITIKKIKHFISSVNFKMFLILRIQLCPTRDQTCPILLSHTPHWCGFSQGHVDLWTTRGLWKLYCFCKKALYSREGVKITDQRNTQPFAFKFCKAKNGVQKNGAWKIQVHTKCHLTASFFNWLISNFVSH